MEILYFAEHLIYFFNFSWYQIRDCSESTVKTLYKGYASRTSTFLDLQSITSSGI